MGQLLAVHVQCEGEALQLFDEMPMRVDSRVFLLGGGESVVVAFIGDGARS